MERPTHVGELGTVDLLERTRSGDVEALGRLFNRCLPPLRKWARGRLPAFARHLSDTQDLVQEAVLLSLKEPGLSDLRDRHVLQAQLRRAILNRIGDEVRRASRSTPATAVGVATAEEASPLEQLVGQDAVERYEDALQRLRPMDRELIVLRLEAAMSYEEIALMLGKPSRSAVRMAVKRALMRLVEEMSRSDRHRPPSPVDIASAARHAMAVADFKAIDWRHVEKHARQASERRPLHQLRLVADITHVHRAQQGGETATRVLPSPDERKWGSLELLGKVSSGTFCEVYRAWDPQLERQVALKLLRLDHSSNVSRAASLLEEGRLLAQLRHDHIVAVYGAAVSGGRAGLSMEFIHGMTLAREMREAGTLSAHAAARVGRDVCRALTAVHGIQLVHGDVKAGNVMREVGGRIVLMDFGAARSLTGPGADGSSLVGTPAYLAPELLQGAEKDGQSDLYSVGVLLYHLVSGVYPVTANSFKDLVNAHRDERVTPLTRARADLPDAFVRVVDTALSAKPLRYATAAEMEAALDECLEALGEPVSMAATKGNRDRFAARAGRGLGARRWLLDDVVTDVIRLSADLAVDGLESAFYGADWSFNLAPFLRHTTVPATDLVFLGLYPSGLVRGVSVDISQSRQGPVGTLINPLCLIDPSLADEGQHALHCELELVGLPYRDHARTA